MERGRLPELIGVNQGWLHKKWLKSKEQIKKVVKTVGGWVG